MFKRVFYSVCAFLGVLFVYFFWMPPILGFGGLSVASSSLAPNLLPNDRVFVYMATPELGDLLTFRGDQGNKSVKRLVARSGDEICFNDEDFWSESNPDKKYLGKYTDPSQESFDLYEETAGNHAYKTIYPSSVKEERTCQTVPQDELFFVGDNRANSHDSRYSSFPRISQDQFFFKLSFIIYSDDLSRWFMRVE
ncbi:signal peptidase I [Kiloniella laminariae]|uniref:signal peptidase I n=1 Tax=Kiloniella laminariae TaxID=454162 RepID=UPI00036F5AAC|nr:signal peptidase I [Kiloniella laminariae]